MKLVVDERETEALRAYLRAERPALISSALSIVEVHRGSRIANPTTGAQRSRDLLDRIELVALDRDVLDDAVTYTSARVRSLDAIHLATAVRVGVRRILVYDVRLAEVASVAGLEVLSPGA